MEIDSSLNWKAEDTARQAAAKVQKSGRAAQLRNDVLNCLRLMGQMSADECAGILKESILSIRPRFSELKRDGIIERSGFRVKNQSGATAIVWKMKNG